MPPKDEPVEKSSNPSSKNDAENIGCGICRPLKIRKCPGHGGNSQSTSKSSGADPKKKMDPSSAFKLIKSAITNHPRWTQTADTNKFKFDQKDAPLSLELDLENGHLKINKKHTVIEQDKQDCESFINVLINEFNLFKQELASKGVPTTHLTVTPVSNGTIIALGTKANFDSFMFRLMDKNLLPINVSPELDIENNHRGNEPYKSPTPFSNRPLPKGIVG